MSKVSTMGENNLKPVQVMPRCKPGPPGAQKGDHSPYTEWL